MTRPVWVYLASNSSYIGAFDTDEDALDEALRQDDPQPFIELVEVGP